jgi:protein-L-isoaspartate(D-aspartate) O-methyltransferase
MAGFIHIEFHKWTSEMSCRSRVFTTLVLVAFVLVTACTSTSSSKPDTQGEKDKMSGPFVSEGLDRPQLHDRKVLDAMARVPRHLFVPEEIREDAYSDQALSISMGQTISQPFIVALMTQEARIAVGSKVLEVGTGSGYQAAVLRELGAQVFSIEIIPQLAEQAKERLDSLGYNNIEVRTGDGWQGWPENAPFDAILVTAASPEIPPALLSQLANRGRLIIPVEKSGKQGERLISVERQDNDYVTQDLGAVRFVPLVGEARD